MKIYEKKKMKIYFKIIIKHNGNEIQKMEPFVRNAQFDYKILIVNDNGII